MLGLDAFQVDFGVVAAAAVLAVDGHIQLLADDLTNGADLGWLGGPAAGHARSTALDSCLDGEPETAHGRGGALNAFRQGLVNLRLVAQRWP